MHKIWKETLEFVFKILSLWKEITYEDKITYQDMTINLKKHVHFQLND